MKRTLILMTVLNVVMMAAGCQHCMAYISATILCCGARTRIHPSRPGRPPGHRRHLTPQKEIICCKNPEKTAPPGGLFVSDQRISHGSGHLCICHCTAQPRSVIARSPSDEAIWPLRGSERSGLWLVKSKADSQQPTAKSKSASMAFLAALRRFAGRPGKERTRHGCAPGQRGKI